jgi:citronellol/citronellal dehydrogenase
MSSQIFREDVLKGQTALVTGGATGIGAAVARELGQQGARVIIAARNQERVERAAAALGEELGREVVGLALDIRERDQVQAQVTDIVAAHGGIQILVNNAGGQFMSPAEGIRPRGWDAVVKTNLTGTWNMTRAVADACMLKHGGRVIHITMLTDRGFPGMAHSVAARAGVEAMTRTLAVEWAQRGILMNCVQPGIVNSSGLANYPAGALLAQQTQGEIPMMRLGSCEEIAWMVAFLAGPGGGYITGQRFIVDGGRTLWGNTWPLQPPDPLPPVDIHFEDWNRNHD